jgi:hypothetical protein
VNHRDQPHHAAMAVHGGDEVVIPLRAGQAVVMDSRVVHFSTPNTADHERVVAAFVVAPEEAELVHWWAADGELVRHEVTPDFYVAYQVGSQPEQVPGVLASRRLTGVPFA